MSEAGAKRLSHIVVRLNGDIAEIFTHWLENTFPDRKEKVLNKIRSLFGGKLTYLQKDFLFYSELSLFCQEKYFPANA